HRDHHQKAQPDQRRQRRRAGVIVRPRRLTTGSQFNGTSWLHRRATTPPRSLECPKCEQSQSWVFKSVWSVSLAALSSLILTGLQCAAHSEGNKYEPAI